MFAAKQVIVFTATKAQITAAAMALTVVVKEITMANCYTITTVTAVVIMAVLIMLKARTFTTIITVIIVVAAY